MAELSAATFRSGDPLLVFDGDLTAVSWNAAAEDLTGVSAEDAIGRCCWEVVGGHDGSGNLILRAKSSWSRQAKASRART